MHQKATLPGQRRFAFCHLAGRDDGWGVQKTKPNDRLSTAYRLIDLKV